MTQPAPAPRLDQRLIACQLVSEQKVRECLAAVAVAGRATNEQLSAEVLRRGCVTPWQLDQINRGQTTFFLDQGRYLLLSLIGQGGMGAVYKARHVRMARDVALKVIDPKRVTDQNLIQRFRREVEVCSRLQHEHIVQAFDVGDDAGATFLVLEFVEGADLASLVKHGGPMQPGEAAAICLQAAAGLAYAHAAGVVHRDIKPQNILLSTSGVVKILDMGLARILDETGDDPHTSLTQEGAVMGTVDYMAPEQARDTRSADARSDIYSLGGTLYYLLAGRPPFSGGSMIEKMHRLANEAPSPLEQVRIDCPRELDEIVQKMLAKRPADRYQTAGDVVRALRPLAAERISGRAAITAAVQTAADTLPGVAAVPTDAEVLFSQIDESLLTSVRQRQAPAASLTRRQKLTRGALAVAVLLAVAAIGWSLTGKSKPSAAGRESDRGGQLTVVEQPSAKPPVNIRRSLPAHCGNILRLAWSPDGRFLATGGVDGQVRIREPNAPSKPHVVYDKHHAGIFNLLWSRDGKLLVSGDYHGKIHVWQAASGKTVATTARNVSYPIFHAPTCSQAMAIAPNNQEIAFEENGNIVRYSLKEKRRVWGSGGGGTGICYSPSGDLLASSAGPFVWETATGEAVYGRPTGPTVPSTAPWIIPAFLPDDTLALADAKRIRLLDCRKDELIAEVPIPEPALIKDSGPWFPMLAFAPAGDRCQLLTFTELVDIRLPEGTRTSRRLPEPLNQAEAAGGFKYCDFSAWEPNFHRHEFAYTWMHDYAGWSNFVDLDSGKTRPLERAEFVCGAVLPFEAGTIGLRFLRAKNKVWDLSKAKIAADVPVNSRLIEGQRVRSIQEDRVVTRPADDGPLDEIPAAVPLEGLAGESRTWPMLRVSEDGQTIWGPTADGMNQYADDIIALGIRLWDAQTGILRRTIDFGASLRGWPSMARDGRTLAMNNHNDSTIWVWRTTSDQPALKFTHELSMDGRHPAISPDGRRIAASAGHKDTVTIYGADDGQKLLTFSSGLSGSLDPGVVQFSSTGKFLLVTRKIWDCTTVPPKLVWTCPEEDHAFGPGAKYRAGEFFDDERHVLIAQDAQLQIWDWRDSIKLATLFFLPGDQTVFVNHVTGHFSGSPSAYQCLRTDFDREDGRPPVEVTIREYEQGTTWKNKPKQAGLDLAKRTSLVP